MTNQGARFSHYEILSPIGAGGMGEVYLAEDTKLDRQVALKILPENFAKDSERMRRFVQEAKSASALNHPNIITIYEIGETDSGHYIATEYIAGETLRHHIQHAQTQAPSPATGKASDHHERQKAGTRAPASSAGSTTSTR